MIWLLGGYMWLFVHRPFEIYLALGEIQFERGYMLFMLLVWLVSPNKGLVGNRIHAAVACFTFAMLVTWVMSPYADKPNCILTVENYAKVAVFYVLVITTVRDEKQLRRLVFLFLTATGLYMLHSLWEYLHGRYEFRMGISRMTGVDLTFCDPNAFASTLLYTLPLLLPFWREQPRRVPHWFILGYGGCAASCILLTGSRTGFVGLVLFLLILVVWCAKNKYQAIAVAGVLGFLAFAVLSIALPGELQERYLTLIDSSRGPANAEVSAGGRLEGFLWGMYVWQQSPLLGFGPASFAFSTGRGGQAHNLYGQVMSEMGLVGGIALFAILACFLFNWRESRRLALQTGTPTTDITLQIAQAVGVNVILLLVMGWAGHNLFRYNWLWLASFSAISVHCLRLRLASQEQVEWQDASTCGQLGWQP
jgi:O-antigen ligase